MSGRGKRVAVARMKKGVLHIAAPLRESLPKHPKQYQNYLLQKKEQELVKRKDWGNPQESQEE